MLWLILLLAGPRLAWGSQTLSGHVPAMVAHLASKGILPATNRLKLAIGLPLHDAPGLDAFLARLKNPASPDYHRYLTPEQFTERFGPTKQDYSTVMAFARRHHLTITRTHGNRLLLDVTGTAADIEQAFHVTLRVYRHPTEARDFYAPDTEPSVEDGVSIADISGLNNYSRPHPKSLKMEARPTPGSAAPKYGSGQSGTYVGRDFRAAYLPGTYLTGAGQQVGLLEFDGYYASDIAAYETNAGLPAVPLQNVSIDNFNGIPESQGGDLEVSLDIEMVACMAPGLAKIVVFEGDGNNIQPNDILNTMAASNQVSQLSSSWGWNGGPDATTDNIFKQMAAQGQSYYNAVGDTDAFTPGGGSDNGVDNPSLDDFPSSSPYVIQVGGTTLSTTGPGGTWASESVWNWGLREGSYVGTSGGISSFYTIPDWQTNVDMTTNGGSTAFRNVPDVALTADNIYVNFGNGTNGEVGGTSCAAPLWAGLTALMNEQASVTGGPTVGFINPAIYALGENTNYADDFHDITNGDNTWSESTNEFYAVTGYDLCTGWGTPAGQSLINALAGLPEPLGILPDTGFTITGELGGPFGSAAENFTLTNFGSATFNWVVTNSPAWLTVTPASGTLAPGGNCLITARLNSVATNLLVGAYTNTLSFSDLPSGIIQGRQVVLQVAEPLGILPATDLTVSGEVGGPFSVTATNLVLTNRSAFSLGWSLGSAAPWLTVTPASGTLSPNHICLVTATVNSAARTLPAGIYTNSLSFTDEASGVSQSRQFVLQLGQSLVQNGGFETGDFTDWTLVGDGVSGEYIYNAVETAFYRGVVHSGNYGAFLGDNIPATLSQNLTTVPGRSYRLSFWLDNPISGPGQQFAVNWITNRTSASQIFEITNPPVFPWTNLAFIVAATDTNTILQFAAENPPNYFGLDDVSATPIPAPSFIGGTMADNALSLTWYSVAGVNYEVLFATNLAQNGWTVLSTNMASDVTLSVTNNLGGGSQGFYRIRRVP